jgi:drug/metabolite transporter (DMT)-like permease
VKPTRPLVLFIVMSLIWGTTWIAAKAGISVVPPWLFSGTRFVVAGTLMLAALRWQGPWPRVARRDLPRLVAVTFLIVTATYGFLFWGAVFVSSGLAAVLDLAFIPISLFAIGLLLSEEAFNLIRSLGVLCGVLGIVALFGPKALAGDGRDAVMELLGGGAIIVAAIVYSLGSVLARPLLRAYPPPFLAGLTTLGGGSALLALSLLAEPGAVAALDLRWGAAAWAGWLFLVVFGSLAAYTIYMRLLFEWGPSRAGSYAFVSPGFAVALGVVVFGEPFRLNDAIGMVFMISGAFLVLREPAAAPTVAPVATTPTP